MKQNPYETPRSESVTSPPPKQASYQVAQSNLRFAMVILLVPGIFNFFCFDSHTFTPSRIHAIYRGINLSAILALVVAIWFLGLPALEWSTSLIHMALRCKSNLDEWIDQLYVTTKRMPWFALPGALLWFAWSVGFYILEYNFYLLSVPIGFAAHLLAACLYIPLFYRWYCIERAARVA